MSIGTVAVTAVAAAISALIIKQYKPEFSILISLAFTVIIFAAVFGKVENIMSQVSGLLGRIGYMNEFAEVVFKGLGVCVLVQIASDTCRDAGESAISSKLEFAGKIMILFISMPLVFKVIETASQLIVRGDGL